MSILTAATFAIKTLLDVHMEAIVYSDKYNGSQEAEKVNVANLYDVSALFYLNSIAENLHPGDVAGRQKLLDYLVQDEGK